MAYQIYDITSFPVDEYPYYYCDANVWIAALKCYCSGSVDAYEEPYHIFIEAVVNLNEEQDSQVLKTIKHQPKIILTSLVLSEIVNSFMRNVAMKSYFMGSVQSRQPEFKKDYRDNPSSDYRRQLKNLCTDIIAFSDYTILQDDEFNKTDPYSWIGNLHTIDADFNDLYYFEFLKDKNIPFVTSDKDFKFQDVPIVTANRKLLNLI